VRLGRPWPDEGSTAARGKRPPRVKINAQFLMFGFNTQLLTYEIDSKYQLN